jgi:negative regulator of sigma E activity
VRPDLQFDVSQLTVRAAPVLMGTTEGVKSAMRNLERNADRGVSKGTQVVKLAAPESARRPSSNQATTDVVTNAVGVTFTDNPLQRRKHTRIIVEGTGI